MEPLALTVAEASRLSGLPDATLRDLIRVGELAVVRYGGGRHRSRYLILPADLRTWLQRHRQPAKWQVNGDSPTTEGETPGNSATTNGPESQLPQERTK